MRKARLGPRPARERGQALILFVLALAVLLGFVALAIDVGMAFEERRSAQNAVDAGALAGAKVLSDTQQPAAAIAEARAYLNAHGYDSSNADITINIPPASGPNAGNPNYIEVIVSRDQGALFRAPLTDSIWEIHARAVATVGSAASVPPYTFASLRDDCKNHTLLLEAGGTLTVNGAIYVNSCNVSKPVPPGYGDAFDIFGKNGKIVAQAVYVVGGWETHDGATVSPDPLIYQPKLIDPAKDLKPPDLASLPTRYGSPTKPQLLKISTGTTTLQPGAYYGGIKIEGNANVTMASGVYYIASGGFKVLGNAILNAPDVMIYNGTRPGKTEFGPVELKSSTSITMGPMDTGPYAGMLIFSDRANDKDIEINPGNGINGLSGTIYAAHKDALVEIRASGTANMQIMAGMILVQGANATFQWEASGLFSTDKAGRLTE